VSTWGFLTETGNLSRLGTARVRVYQMATQELVGEITSEKQHLNRSRSFGKRRTLKCSVNHPTHAWYIALSPDGRYLATAASRDSHGYQ
jgi:hypothetical protein